MSEDHPGGTVDMGAGRLQSWRWGAGAEGQAGPVRRSGIRLRQGLAGLGKERVLGQAGGSVLSRSLHAASLDMLQAGGRVGRQEGRQRAPQDRQAALRVEGRRQTDRRSQSLGPSCPEYYYRDRSERSLGWFPEKRVPWTGGSLWQGGQVLVQLWRGLPSGRTSYPRA